jgi:hypothetical protein
MRYLLSFLVLINLPTIGNSQSWNKVYNASLDVGLVSSFFVNDSAIFISGAFDSVNGQLVNHIAYFDGLNWGEMNDGISSKASRIFAFEGNIYAGGVITSAGGNSSIRTLVYFNGINWEGFGTSVTESVNDIEIYEDKLYGIGNFTNLFGVTGLNDVFQYDGTAFTDLNGGLLGGPASCRELEVLDGLLVAGGLFQSAGGVNVSNLAAWDGDTWTSFAGGTNAIIYAMTTDTINEYLYISGDFTVVGGTLPVSYFARWDGYEWINYDGGLSCGAFDMCLYQNQLYVGGCFNQAGGKPIGYIARYNGTVWDSLGTSINNEWGVQALATFQDELYVGGDFTQIGDTVVPGLAKWSFPLDSACKEMYAGIGAYPDTIYTGQLPYTFRSDCYGNGSLQWEFSDGYTSPKGHTTYDFNNIPDTYDIMLTAQCGTYADTVYSQVVIVSNVGIETENQIEMKIYPNPSDGKISIYAEELIGKDVSISIFDIQGKNVLQKEIRFNSSTVELDLDLEKGSYQIAVVIDGKMNSQTLIVE